MFSSLLKVAKSLNPMASKANVDHENKLNDEIAAAIRGTFVRRINARTFTFYTRTKLPNIFTKEDYSHFNAQMVSGAKNINEDIFDTLIKYKDWFSCLIQAVSDPTYNQTDLVQIFIDLKDSVVKQFGASSSQFPSSSTNGPSANSDGKSASQNQDRENLLNDELASAVKETFVRRINARPFLNYTKLYESSIFTKEDYNHFDLVGKERSTNVNEEIFDTLIKYNGWFNCLIKAVGYPLLNQTDLVSTFLSLKDEVQKKMTLKATPPPVIPQQADSQSEGNINAEESHTQKADSPSDRDPAKAPGPSKTPAKKKATNTTEASEPVVKKVKKNEEASSAKKLQGKPEWCRCGFCDLNEDRNEVCCYDLHKLVEDNYENKKKKKVLEAEKCMTKWSKLTKSVLSRPFLEREPNWRLYKLETNPTDDPKALFRLGCCHFRSFVNAQFTTEKTIAVPSCVIKKLKSRCVVKKPVKTNQ
ncbi:uncharacterized protein LOC131938689 isoform X2 [Physella acuta]|uniref:uncharacterized protein LOC131938689 isoform X2 n=1 Tax=Physella acuta TaxID=109671 RepID=UPI0027DDFB0C|nr:uncharacterized protein LOC131938689 isoform X2 [Physella acuta]